MRPVAVAGLLSARAVALWCIAVALRSDLAVAPITAEQRSEDRGALSPFAAPRSFVAAAGRDREIIAGQGVVPSRQAPRSVL